MYEVSVLGLSQASNDSLAKVRLPDRTEFLVPARLLAILPNSDNTLHLHFYTEFGNCSVGNVLADRVKWPSLMDRPEEILEYLNKWDHNKFLFNLDILC